MLTASKGVPGSFIIATNATAAFPLAAGFAEPPVAPAPPPPPPEPPPLDTAK